KDDQTSQEYGNHRTQPSRPGRGVINQLRAQEVEVDVVGRPHLAQVEVAKVACQRERVGAVMLQAALVQFAYAVKLRVITRQPINVREIQPSQPILPEDRQVGLVRQQLIQFVS